MQASTPLTPQGARKIALQQGLRFGTFAGCAALLGMTFLRTLAVSTSSLNLLFLLAFIAFFVAGHRTAKRTHRIDMSALAGFWAGVAVALSGLVILLVFALIDYQDRVSISLSALAYSVLNGVIPALLAVLLGTGVGVLGGFLGNIYAENAASPSPAPAKSTVSDQSSLSPVQPAPSSDALDASQEQV